MRVVMNLGARRFSTWFWFLLCGPLYAAENSASGSQLPLTTGNGQLSAPMQTVLLLGLLSFLPILISGVTPFLRITVVLHFLRQALGSQTVPSNQVMIGLALFLSMLVMQPVLTDIYDNAWKPYEENRLDGTAALDAAGQPLRNFLLRFAREKDIQLFLEISKKSAPQAPEELELSVLVPAYILSEIKAAFQIGAVLYLPFLIIDLVVASVTLSIGMVMLPPMMISAPFKILLFVLVDGWTLLIGSLVQSFYS